MTCIHADKGLCPACQAEHDGDPMAYWEFGDHPEGIARWQALRAEIAAEREQQPDAQPCNDEDMPF